MFDRKPLIDRPEIFGDNSFRQSSGSCVAEVNYPYQLSGSGSVSVEDAGESLNNADELNEDLRTSLDRSDIYGSRVIGVKVSAAGSFGFIRIQTTGLIDGEELEGGRDMAFGMVETYLGREYGGNWNMSPTTTLDMPAISVESSTSTI